MSNFKTLKGIAVRKISKDANGNPLNIVVLDIGGGRPAIVRSNKEFLTDLQNSYLVPDTVQNINHPLVLEVLKDMSIAPFTMTGNVMFAKKGELWTVTENSRVVTDRNHPKYGSVVAGDKLPYEKDMSLVTEGFLTIALNPTVSQQNKIAMSTGQAMAQLLNTADEIVDSGASYGSEEPPVFDATDLPDNVLAEATAGATTEQETTETAEDKKN